VPAIDFDVNHFVGVSEYWHTTHSVFEMGHDEKAYDFKTYQNRVNEFCSQSWSDIEVGIKKKKWGKKVDEKTAEEVCFKASWLINMLHEGIGIPRVGLEMKDPHGGMNTTKQLIDSAKSKGFLDPFQAVDKIEGTEVSWTLGKMVLYASSQIPPADENLPVGFGTNSPGVALPKDFQLPGGSDFKLPDDLIDLGNADPVVETEDSDWHDALFRDSPRRIPGFLLFMLILIVLVFLICGRERRSAIYTKLRHLAGFKRSPSSSSRFGKYDRVVDDPEAVGEFEMGATPYDDVGSDNEHSDGSEGATSSREHVKAPGWATPTLSLGLPDERGGSPGKKGLATAPLWAAGLMSRTDSRDRLSRAGSPRPGFRAAKESVD